MKSHRFYVLALCTVLALPVMMQAQATTTAAKQIAPAESLKRILNILESEITSAAEAMPADKYNYAPATGDFKGVRDFGGQVKHLAEANYEFFEGWGIPNGVDPKTIEALKTKDEIVKALKDSYVYVHAAVDSVTVANAFEALPGPENRKATRVSALTFCMAHSMDHYGQMVEYLRLNGIIPPASRKGGM